MIAKAGINSHAGSVMKRRSPNPNYDRQSRIGRLLNRVKSGLEDALDRELAACDLTAAQYVVMSILASGKAETGAEICKEIVYDPGSMTRMLDRLEQKNLVRRLYSRENRRKVKLELTEQGRTIFPQVQARSAALMERVMGALSAEELDQLEGFLVGMAGRLELRT
jgi:DNA-binding MarR family transcriptional regulator